MSKGKRRKNDDGSRGALIFLMVLLIIAVIGVLGYTGKVYLNENKNESSTLNAQSSNVTENKDDKKDEENNKEDVEEKKDEEQKTEEPEEKKDEEQPKEEVAISDEEKAIDMAKKQFGTTDGVYFRIEQIQSNNVYIVSVRDNETTGDLAWYTIDVKNGTVK